MFPILLIRQRRAAATPPGKIMLPSARRKPQLYRSHPRHPPVDFITLCRLLELEIQLGQTAAFRRRLRRVFAQLQRETR